MTPLNVQGHESNMIYTLLGRSSNELGFFI